MNQPMRTWLSRLAFSFFIIAFVLAFELSKLARASGGFANVSPRWKLVAYLAGTIICVALGAIGMRARHRTDE